MSRSFAFLVVFLLAGVPVSARAQTHPAQGLFLKAQSTIVTFTVTAKVGSPSGEGLGLPPALVERLSRQSTLAQMDLGGGTNKELMVRFIFPSVEAFQTWNTSADTRQLMQDLKAVAFGGLGTSLAVKRLPLSEIAAG